MRDARPYVAYQRITTGADGTPCTTTGYRVVPAGIDAGFAALPDRDFRDILATYQPCSRPARSSSVAASVAEGFWQEVPLPSPRPHIAPGRAVTGKAAYLETNGTTTHSFSRDTPLGPLAITATGAYVVDWGDGTTTGPHPGEGGPWPAGRITHTYADVGTYDVVVSERWSATWRIGEASGTLSELRTTGTIEDLDVGQIQAVIVR